jgi:hypothetical protein
MTQEPPLGQLLLDGARQARRRALLCAPFVKAAVIEQLLAVLEPGVEVELFTRWRPEEVAAGVSDTTVLGPVVDRGGSVFLCDHLHAKLFLFDETCLTGSANLTAKALGWSADSNLELLVQVSPDLPEVRALELELRTAAVPASEEIAAEIERVAALLPRASAPPAEEPKTGKGAEPRPWHPLLREPRDLFVAYEQGPGRLSAASAAAALEDLAHLEVSLGLGREQFESLVGARLLQEPLIQQIDDLLARSRRFGEIRDFFAKELDLPRDEAVRAWQTTMRWMLHFLPHRYERFVPSHSEMMVRKEAVS